MSASQQTTYHTVQVNNVEVFYRQAGSKDAPVLLMLHGFPSSSHQYRNVIPIIAAEGFRVIAPDLPGFGSTKVPEDFEYTFDALADVVDAFTEKMDLDKYALYIFDYGAPVGMRLAVHHPDRVSAIISQNGNAYEEGITEAWEPFRAYWADGSAENRDALRGLLTRGTTEFQYMTGVPDDRRKLISPDPINHDQAILDRDNEIQLDLFGNYKTNVEEYPTWQAYLREHKPPLLAVWGENDPFFGPAGAKAFRKDVSDAEVVLIDAGHFALESHGPEISARIVKFLQEKL